MAEHSLLNTTFPVLLPEMPELHLEKRAFMAAVKSLVHPGDPTAKRLVRATDDPSASGTEQTAMTGIKREVETAKKEDTKDYETQNKPEDQKEAPFMTYLLAGQQTVPSFDERDGKMLTENADVAYKTSGQALVDLFFELEDTISAKRLREILDKAWQIDSDATLKIIWNARSVHLGKASRNTFYRAAGWLAENHPMTLINNLPYLVKPCIQKKVPKKNEDEVGKDAEMVDAKDVESDFEMIDEKEELAGQPEKKKMKLDEESELSQFEIKYGVAHGYWKDLLNILTLAANGELKVSGNPRSVLNVDKPRKNRLVDWSEGRKKLRTTQRHDRISEKLEKGGLYRALHLVVARLFADQLKTDLARLKSGEKSEKKLITFAAKWSPSHKGFHDEHTFITSTIAELLHPFSEACPQGADPKNRELYLKHARIAFQSQTLSPLRKYIDIVERPISFEKFEDIKYDRVPSLAMKQYIPLFAKKDTERFEQYLESVASGKAQISGATLLPSTLVQAVIQPYVGIDTKKPLKQLIERKMANMKIQALDGQWNTLVQRIKDSGTLENSIAIADVSGSMLSPTFGDGTNPMCSSIGLSLLLSEVTKPPFGGAVITFSEEPAVLRVGGANDKRSFSEKIQAIQHSTWSMNTNFVAVFEELVLPIAIENKLTQEDMVKQIFVFSDMQFDQARSREDRWTTSYERIQKKFEKAGYEMPRLIFWNLAGSSSVYSGSDVVAPKPVTAAEENTALVSGYSQAMLKMFLDSGSFEDVEEEVVETVNDEGEVVVSMEKKKQNPLDVVKRAISHEAYRMLKVVD